MKDIRIPADKQRERSRILDHLYMNLLKGDPEWHYFLDPGGITLRVADTNGKKLLALLKDDFGFEGIGSQDYSEKMEYRGTRKHIDDLLRVFHLISDLTMQHRSDVVKGVIWERLTHQIANHYEMNHLEEAKMLSDAALGRARVSGWADQFDPENSKYWL